jgi:hypothetical protein
MQAVRQRVARRGHGPDHGVKDHLGLGAAGAGPCRIQPAMRPQDQTAQPTAMIDMNSAAFTPCQILSE